MAEHLRPRHKVLCGLYSVAVGLAVVGFLTGCQNDSKATKDPTASKPAVAERESPLTPVAVQKPSAEGPRLTFEETSYDFGSVAPGKTYTRSFKFKNTGTAPLKIISIQPCCGTVVKGIDAGQVYAPGRGGSVEWEYTAAMQPGAVNRTFYVTTNDPTQPTMNLTFKADIARQIECEPAALRLFLRRENGGARDLTIKSCTGDPFSVKSFASTGNSVTATFDPNVKDTKIVLKLSADMEKLKQHPRGRALIGITHPGAASFEIDYDVLPEFTVSPPQLMAFNLKPGEPAPKEVWILGNYDNDFEIESITSLNGILKVMSKEKVKMAPGLSSSELSSADDAKPSKKEDQYQYRLKLEVVPPADRSTTLSDTLLVTIKGGDTLKIEYKGFFAADN
jgi:hypothetical protein